VSLPRSERLLAPMPTFKLVSFNARRSSSASERLLPPTTSEPCCAASTPT
jgi:hypothetical protein